MNFKAAFFLLIALTADHSAKGAVLSEHPVRSIRYWKDSTPGSLESKLREKTPPEIIDYLIQDNRQSGWTNTPNPVVLSAAMKRDLLEALRGIPADVQQKVNQKLLGIFVVTDLGGSAYTDCVQDGKGKEVAGFVVVDITAMDHTANQWATWKESSPFHWQGADKLEAIVEPFGGDTRVGALQYILLHEFGHILNIGSSLLPGWGQRPEALSIVPSMRFFNASWEVQGNQFASHYDDTWKGRPKIRYYTSPENQLTPAVALESYRHLTQTNFPTLYASTNPGDDFAESFVNYVHVVRMKKPWSISLSVGKERLTVHDCWQEPRCQTKRKIIEEVLAP